MRAFARLRCAGVMRGKPPPGVRSISGSFLLMRSSIFAFSAVLPESRSCPMPAACLGVGTLACFGPSWPEVTSGHFVQKWRRYGVLPQPVVSLSDGHSLVLVHR